MGTKIFYLEKQSGNSIFHKYTSLGRCDGGSFWKQSSMYFIFLNIKGSKNIRCENLGSKLKNV